MSRPHESTIAAHRGFASLIADRNRDEQTNGYTRWHALDIMVQAQDLEFQAGVPDARAARNAMTWALREAQKHPNDPASLRHAAVCIALQLEYLEDKV